MKFSSITTDLEQIRSCARAELTNFWTKEARIRFTDIAADAASGVVAEVAHTFM